ncbi:MAG: hypothetical protein U5K29_04505 [Acidimicrobiales bacterium]|nr:hypothetical protein [Acidimicrobiales bacterium]
MRCDRLSIRLAPALVGAAACGSVLVIAVVALGVQHDARASADEPGRGHRSRRSTATR